VALAGALGAAHYPAKNEAQGAVARSGGGREGEERGGGGRERVHDGNARTGVNDKQTNKQTNEQTNEVVVVVVMGESRKELAEN
jgi:hypothetical protein